MRHRRLKNSPIIWNQSVKPRDHSLDNLRSFLTALVIIHHTAVFYGGFGHGPLRSSCFPTSSLILTAFNALNQSFFMGLFFYLSGRFAQTSLDRESETKKAKQIRFIKGRCLRILLPAIFYSMFLHPALDIIKYVCGRDMGLKLHGMTNWATQIVLIHWNSWTDGGGIKGPVWYLGLLFIFDSLSMVATVCRNRARTGPRIPKARMLQLYLLVVLSSFTIRLFYPVGTILPILSIQPGYLPQYVFAYIVGRLSVTYGDVLLLDVSPLRCGPKYHLALSAVFQLIGLGVISLTMRTGLKSDKELLQLLTGGLNLPALLYAAWNEVGLALVGSSLIALFTNYVNFPVYLNGVKSDHKSGSKQSSPHPLVARYSYAAFLVHPLVSLAVEILVDGVCDDAQSRIWKLLGPVLLTIIVGVMNVAASWAVAYLVCHYVPGVRRIL